MTNRLLLVLLAFATLNHCPLLKKGVTLDEQFRAAADAGFTYVSPDIFSLRAWRESGQTYTQLGDALNAGYEKNKLAPFLVKKIEAREQAAFMTRDVLPCPI